MTDTPDVDELLEKARGNTVGQAPDEALIGELQNRGHRVILEPREGKEQSTRIPEVTEKDRFKFAVASDWHLGSKYQQLTHLRTFMAEAEKQGCDFALCPGDIYDGTSKARRAAATYDQFVHGADAMLDYSLEAIPAPAIPWYLISGNHDWWYYQDAGLNIVKQFCKLKDGFTHAGDLGTELALGPLQLYIWHPRGGVAYARSYRLQKWINERPVGHRPHIVLGGHFHVGAYLSRYGGVEGFQCPAFQSQTPYEKELGLNPEIGGIILDVGLDDEGELRRLRHEWIKFPDWIRDDYH